MLRAPPAAAAGGRSAAGEAAAAAAATGRACQRQTGQPLRCFRRDLLCGTAASAGLLTAALAQPSSSTAATAAAAVAAGQRRHGICPGPVLDLQAQYDRYALTYDQLDGGAASQALGFPQLRAELLQQARGDVLEVAVGTGLNLPLYVWPAVTSYRGVDLSPGMLAAAAARAAQLAAAGTLPAAAAAPEQQQQQQQQQQLPALRAPPPAAQQPLWAPAAATRAPAAGLPSFALLQGDAAALPFPDASFDTICDTFSLCVIARPLAALQEMRRVLRPGGRLLLLEHSRSDNALLGGYQDLTEPLVTPLSKGCVWNQDLAQLMAAAGLVPLQLRRHLAGTVSSLVAAPAAEQPAG